MGTYLVEHNVLASRPSFESFSQGGAFVHNLGWLACVDAAGDAELH
jgi:hypothetical protein